MLGQNDDVGTIPGLGIVRPPTNLLRRITYNVAGTYTWNKGYGTTAINVIVTGGAGGGGGSTGPTGGNGGAGGNGGTSSFGSLLSNGIGVATGLDVAVYRTTVGGVPSAAAGNPGENSGFSTGGIGGVANAASGGSGGGASTYGFGGAGAPGSSSGGSTTNGGAGGLGCAGISIGFYDATGFSSQIVIVGVGGTGGIGTGTGASNGSVGAAGVVIVEEYA